MNSSIKHWRGLAHTNMGKKLSYLFCISPHSKMVFDYQKCMFLNLISKVEKSENAL